MGFTTSTHPVLSAPNIGDVLLQDLNLKAQGHSLVLRFILSEIPWRILDSYIYS